jgi:hypothetical protein
VSLTSAPDISAGIVSAASQANSIVAQLQPALAGLSPVLKILDAMQAMFDVVSAAPEIPIDPTGFFEALANLGEKMAALAPLVPQVSIPATVVSSLRAITAFLKAVRDNAQRVADMETAAQALMDQAIEAGDQVLQAQAQCQLDTSSALAAHTAASLDPISSLLGLITTLLELVPLGFEIPDLGDLSGLGPQQLVDALDAIIAAFEALPL